MDFSYTDTGFVTKGAIQLALYVFVMVIALILVEKYVPRLLKGICRAVVTLGGLYLFAKFIST